MPRAETTLLLACLSAIAIHGPLDVFLTSLAFHFESNPLVTQLGLKQWVFLKASLSLGLIWFYYNAKPPRPKWYQTLTFAWFWFLSGFGFAWLLLNAYWIMAT